MATPADIRRQFDRPVGANLGSVTPDGIRTKNGVPGGEPWTFTQLGGDKKTLTLEGWNAPFGRPRKSPVATTSLEVRESERRYPGCDTPTRFLYGVLWDDIELNGRWMDSVGGRGFAKQQTELVFSFINDQQKVRISWGNTLSVTGLIKRLDPEWEGPADVAWKLRILVDSNDSLKPTVGPIAKAKGPGTILNRMIELMSDSVTKSLSTPPILKPDFLSFLDELITFINGPAADILAISGSVSSFKDATFSELARLRGVLQQYRQGIQSFRSIYESAKVEAAIEYTRAEDEISLYRQQAAFGATMASALFQIAQADQAAARAQRSRIKAIATARPGDSWESISVRVYGSAGRAADIQEANAIPAGQQPQAGGTYIAPS